MQQLLVPYESFGHLRSSGTRLLCVHRTKTEHSEAAFSSYASLFSAFHLYYLQNEGATKNELKRYEKPPPSLSARQAVELFRRLATVASQLICGRMHCKYCRLCSFNELGVLRQLGQTKVLLPWGFLPWTWKVAWVCAPVWESRPERDGLAPPTLPSWECHRAPAQQWIFPSVWGKKKKKG